MKKWKNIRCYCEAADYLKANYHCPIFTEDGQLTDFYRANWDSNTVLNVIALLEGAKNSATRAAVHKVLIGNAMIDYKTIDDSTPYYDSEDNYLGRGIYEIAAFRPGKDGTYANYTIGETVVNHRTPLDE